MAASLSARRVKLFLCGDVMTGRGVDQILAHPAPPHLREAVCGSALDYVALAEQAHGPIPRGVGAGYIWGDALSVWDEARPDLRIANLETSLTLSEAFEAKGVNYRMSPANAACLRAARLDCCALANNHVLDFGRSGLAETLQTLADLRVAGPGAGRDLAAARSPAVLRAPGGGRVLIFACAVASSGVPDGWAAGDDQSGVNLVELSSAGVRTLCDAVLEHRREGDLVIVSIHWGLNWSPAVPESHRSFAHALIDEAAVHLIHGHSAHHPMGIEVFRGRLILYGCGDFINDYEGIPGYEAFRPDLCAMYFASLDARSGELASLEIHPMQIRGLRLNRASRADRTWLGEALTQSSAPLGTRFEQAGAAIRLA